MRSSKQALVGPSSPPTTTFPVARISAWFCWVTVRESGSDLHLTAAQTENLRQTQHLPRVVSAASHQIQFRSIRGTNLRQHITLNGGASCQLAALQSIPNCAWRRLCCSDRPLRPRHKSCEHTATNVRRYFRPASTSRLRRGATVAVRGC